MLESIEIAVRNAFKDLKKIQTGERALLKTGAEMIDCHIKGLLPGDVVVIGGAPSSGKSETLYRMLDDILSLEVNPGSGNYVSLEFSMEMKMLNKLMRKLSRLLGKKKSEILYSEFSEEEKAIVSSYFESLKDERRSVIQSPVTPKQFYSICKEYCTTNIDKDAVVISIDHMLLFSGSDKQSVLEEVSECINLLKLEFSNVYFIVLSQLNRNILGNIKESDNSMIPNNSMLYGSSFMEQLASYIIIITNPFKQGINNYLKVNYDRYEYLENFYGKKDTKGRVSFDTLGNLFYFVTKARESDNSYKDLFINKMDLTTEQLEKLRQSIVDNTPDSPVEKASETVEMPVFFSAAMNKAREESPF